LPKDEDLTQRNFVQTLIIVLLTALVVLWLPVFAGYYGLMEADCLVSDLSIENADLEIGLLGDKNSLLAVAPASCYFQKPFIYYREIGLGGGISFCGSKSLHQRC
jgi:hypothetical protein